MARSLNIKCLIPDENNRQYGGTELISSIVDGNEKIYTPLLVEKAEKAGQYYVIDGHRRLASAIKAGIESVPCEILTKDEAERAKAITNIDRQSLSPLDQYTSIMQLKLFGYNNSCIGNMLGISKYQVERRLRLNNLIEPLKKKLIKGELSVDKASEFALASPEIQKKVLEKVDYILQSAYSQKDVRRAINLTEGIALGHYSNAFVEMGGVWGCSCLECKSNPNSDCLLFENPSKEESFCTLGNYSCISDKLVRMCLDSNADGICTANKEIADYAKGKGIKILERSWPRYTQKEDEWLSSEVALDDDGEIIYQDVVLKDDVGKDEKLNDKAIEKAIDQCKKTIDSIMDLMLSVYRSKAMPLLPADVRLALIISKYREGSYNNFLVWDSSLGRDLEGAIAKMGLEPVIEGKAKDPLKSMDSEDVSKLLRHILFEKDIYLLLKDQKIYSVASLTPTFYSVKCGSIDKALGTKLERILERAKAWWPASTLWDSIYEMAGRYNKLIETMVSLSENEKEDK